MKLRATRRWDKGMKWTGRKENMTYQT